MRLQLSDLVNDAAAKRWLERNVPQHGRIIETSGLSPRRAALLTNGLLHGESCLALSRSLGVSVGCAREFQRNLHRFIPPSLFGALSPPLRPSRASRPKA